MTEENHTPFKHTGCGGIIDKAPGWRGGLVYRCEQCGAVSKEIDDLLFTEASFWPAWRQASKRMRSSL